jgi:hypothetical protein
VFGFRLEGILVIALAASKKDASFKSRQK